MKHLQIVESPVRFNPENYYMIGQPVICKETFLVDIKQIFAKQDCISLNDHKKQVYSVQAWLPESEGTSGGLFFGVSTIYPGKVGDEYYMTKGHFHSKSDRTEFYWGIQGEGMLVLMDRQRNTWAEKVFPGSLHYIKSHIAHRLCNTGDKKLIVGACWPSDAGHDYLSIAENGFSARLFDVNAKPMLINEK